MSSIWAPALSTLRTAKKNGGNSKKILGGNGVFQQLDWLLIFLFAEQL